MARTIEEWAERYITTDVLAEKLDPEEPPSELDPGFEPKRLAAPGRPRELTVSSQTPRRRRGLRSALARARLLHTFFHHELQAAELMAWALLAFPEAPEPMRRGFLRIALDEVRHMGLYRAHIEKLGFRLGDFPVRDFFWSRITACDNPASFVAALGIGFEGGNIEHARDFAAQFRAVGDEEGAQIQELIGREEIGHVRFAVHWFTALSGPLTFERWLAHVPRPLSPMVFRGRPIDRQARMRAGLDAGFVDALDAWHPE